LGRGPCSCVRSAPAVRRAVWYLVHVPSRKLARGEPDCPTEVAPLGSSGFDEWTTDPMARPSGALGDAMAPIASEHAVLGRGPVPRAEQPSSDQPLATLDAAMHALHHVMAELAGPTGSLDAKRSTLRAEVESVLEALTAVAAQQQSARRQFAEHFDAAREEAETRERSLMEQQDGVLEALLTEHERQTQALEHELDLQRQYATALRQELDQKTELVESLSHQQAAPARHPQTPRTWPPSAATGDPPASTGDPPIASTSHAPAAGRASVARLVADRDHLLASLKLLKRQRDDAQQETLDLVEQLAAANNEIEALRAQLPSVSAPPVPSSRRGATTGRPPAPALAPEPTSAPEARSASTQPPIGSGPAVASPLIRASKRPTLPPDEPPDPRDRPGSPARYAGATPAPRPDASSRHELLPAPPTAPPLRSMTRPGPAGLSGDPDTRAAVDAAGPPPSPDDPPRRSAEGAPLSDRKPPLKRKPDPTRSPLGTYSVTGRTETESLHPPNRGTGRPSGGRQP
jgi:hypothetical protein